MAKLPTDTASTTGAPVTPAAAPAVSTAPAPAAKPQAVVVPPQVATAAVTVDGKAYTPQELANMRAAAEANPTAGMAEHMICGVTGLKMVARTGLVPIKVNRTIPELQINKDEIKGFEPAQAQQLIARGLGVAVLV